MNAVSPAAIDTEIAARSATSANVRVLVVRVRIGDRGRGRLPAPASPRASV
jgi:hypothetical protein